MASWGRPPMTTVLGGGTLIGGTAYLEPLRAAQRAGHQTIVFGTGVAPREIIDRQHGPGSGEHLLRSWAGVLAGCAHVGVRGPLSQSILESVDVASEVLGDTACSLVEALPEGEPPNSRIGVNVGCTSEAIWPASDAEAAAMRIAECLRALDRAGWAIEFVVVTASDLELTSQVRANCGQPDAPVHVIIEDADELLARAHEWSVFVATKLHAAAIAMCAGAPTLCIDYHPKCSDFMLSVDAGDQLLHRDDFTADELVGAVERVAAERASTVARTHSRLVALSDLQRRRYVELSSGIA